MKLLYALLGIVLFMQGGNEAFAGDGSACGGIANVQCSRSEWCDFPDSAVCGIGDVQGECKARKEICTEDEAWVCGCNGRSYGNACKAQRAGTDVSHKGRCGTNANALVASMPPLCPEAGKYFAHRHNVAGQDFVVLGATTTMPSSGWVVALEQRPERILPPMYWFTCRRSGGIDLPVLSDFAASVIVPGADYDDQISVSHKTGEEQVVVTGSSSNTAGAECKKPEDCKGDGEYCHQQRCGQPGTCRKRPPDCIMLYQPVRACNGEVYSNACVANSNGHSVDEVLRNAIIQGPAAKE